MQGYVDAETRKKLVGLIESAVEHFAEGDWRMLGARTGTSDIIEGDSRLLRALDWKDDDYEGRAHSVMVRMVERDLDNLPLIESFIAKRFGVVGESVSTAPSDSKPITFSPNAFQTPATGVENDLVAVMMPFTPQLQPVFETIRTASALLGLRCLRADDIWDHSVVIQDIFSLIYRSHIVVCDFTDKNPNVFYEAGIAHTLGKHVVPMTQSEQDIPFDLRHHRYIRYLNNEEGRKDLENRMWERLRALKV